MLGRQPRTNAVRDPDEIHDDNYERELEWDFEEPRAEEPWWQLKLPCF